MRSDIPVPGGSALAWVNSLAEKHGVEIPDDMAMEIVECLKDPRPITRQSRIRRYREMLKELKAAQESGDHESEERLIGLLDQSWMLMSEDEAQEVSNG